MFHHPYAVDIGGSSNRQEPESEETSSATPSDDYLLKTGGIVTGNITLTSTPTNQNHLTTVRLAENASNLKTGTISKDLLPQTLNSFALNSGAIYLKNPNDSTGYFKEQVISGNVYAAIDGKDGIFITVGGTSYTAMHNNTIYFQQKELDHIKNLKADDLQVFKTLTTDTLTFKQLKSDNTSEPIILNDSGLTLYDHTLRFRGQADNNNSIRWFNGDTTTGQARLELSSIDRLRLSTAKNKDGSASANRDFISAKAQFIELLHDRLNVNNNRITNVALPVDDSDVASKQYVDTIFNADKKKSVYNTIKNGLYPKFWISSLFPFGLNNDKTTIQDLSGTGLTINGSVGRDMRFGLTSRIKSTASFSKQFTFFIKARKISTRNGRLFSSSVGNKIFGWRSSYQRCAWIEGNIYGVTANQQATDSNIHTYILVSNNDTKAFYENKTTIISTTAGGDDWGGQIVIGQPTVYPTENSEFQVYEVMGFDKVLTEAEIFDIHDKIFI